MRDSEQVRGCTAVTGRAIWLWSGGDMVRMLLVMSRIRAGAQEAVRYAGHTNTRGRETWEKYKETTPGLVNR